MKLKQRILSVVLAVCLVAGMMPVTAKAVTMTWVDIRDFKPLHNAVTFETYTEIQADTSPYDGKHYYRESISKGEIVYIELLYVTCTGSYYVVNYEGKVYYVNKSAIGEQKKVNTPKRKTNADVVEKKGLAGDVLQGDDYCYVYSLPDDSKPENCYACVPAGTSVQILDADYNDDWMKVQYGKYYVCYMKKEDVNVKDAYLAGASIQYQPFIKLAKKAKLTYKGILKDYDKTLTKKELCRLAVLWYKAMGNELPKQATTSPFKDTKDKYVIMAYQLGIIESTSDKTFSPKEKLKASTYNAIIERLMEVTNASSDARAVARKAGWTESKVTRDEAIYRLYQALLPSLETGYLVCDSQVGYMIAPLDNQDVCLDVWEESREEGTVIGLWQCKGSANQRFYFDYDCGIYSLKNVNSLYTLSFSSNKVCQRLKGYKSQIIIIEYNDDGSVCIKNGYGQYLDLADGTAESGGMLTFKDKSGSSSQKFVFKYE